MLENLAELTNVVQVGNKSSFESLSIINNPLLTSLEGLENLTSAYKIEIKDNPKLYDFCNLEVVKSPDFPRDFDAYNPESISYSFITSGNKWNPDIRAMKEDLCARDVNRQYGDNTLANTTDYVRYVFLKKGDSLISIEGILTDFGTSQTSDTQAYTYQIGETTDWYILKVPQDFNEKADFYDLLVQSGFYDPTPFSMQQDDNYAAMVMGLGLNTDNEAYIIYEDSELRSDLRYPNPGTEYGWFGTWFGTFQNDEAFVLPTTVYKEAAYPEIKKFSVLSEELDIDLNTLDTIEFRNFEIFR